MTIRDFCENDEYLKKYVGTSEFEQVLKDNKLKEGEFSDLLLASMVHHFRLETFCKFKPGTSKK